MKIEKLIRVFEKLLPIYEGAYKNNYYDERLMYGLCRASREILRIDISDIMDYGYYQNRIVHPNLFGYLRFLFPREDLKSRIDFMKSEIKSLKRLQKKGFTHV